MEAGYIRTIRFGRAVRLRSDDVDALIGAGSVDSDALVADDAPPTDLISRSDISPVGLPAVTPRSIEQLHTRARLWLGSEYDLEALDLTLAAAAVERLDGDRGTRLLGLLYKT